MLRFLTIGICSIVLFVPAYMALHPLFGEGWGATIALGLMYIGFPILLLKLWKPYPPMNAVPIEPDDPILAQCTKRAMGEFERFRKGLAEGRKAAFVKYAIAMKSGGKEHVWGVAHAIQGDHVVVSLASEPVQEVADGESRDPRVGVPIVDIEDWMLAGPDGKCEGGYSNIGLAKIYRRLHGKVPKKYLRDLVHFVDLDPAEYRSL